MLIVQKFGGSSLKDFERLRRVAERCLDRRRREEELVVVVSAMGDTTDSLSRRAQEVSAAPPKRELDALVTTGEQQAAALLVMAMQELGLEAVSLTGWQAGVLTDGQYGAGEIRLVAPGRIRAELSRGRVPVVTGFQGICARGDVTSLGRGGSDTTAVALAAALEADGCEIYTDVDGVYTADPRREKTAQLISEVREITPQMRESAGGGGTALSTGGMATKLTAAGICMDAGTDMFILNGAKPLLIYEALEGKPVGTKFIGRKDTP